MAVSTTSAWTRGEASTPWRLLRQPASFALLVCFIVALGLGNSVPERAPASLLEEGGPIETVTVLLYVLAIALLFVRRITAWNRYDKLAAIVLLAACATWACFPLGWLSCALCC